MSVATLSTAALVLALLPLALFLLNLPFHRPPRGRSAGTGVSVLIPARNEAASIEEAVLSVLANRDVDLEVIVLDDHSEDGTAAVVERLAARDGRVRLSRAPPLPRGWSGKQHACRVLSGLASHPLLVFMDADVRLSPDALARIRAFMARRKVGLASGFPRQVTGTAAERMAIPLMHVLLMGYLPMAGMRFTRLPAFAAGCGQLMACDARAYSEVGGHGAIRASLHDGLMLPRAFRRAGWDTGLFDATELARCRMYRNAAEVWNGLSKNATEGMATPLALPVWTVLLAGGHVLPFALLPAGGGWTAALAAAASLALRLASALRFRQSLWGVLLHPAGVLLLLAVQWSALLRARFGQPVPWRGRIYLPD